MQNGGLRTKGVTRASQPSVPLISVVTVVRNGAAMLEQTILSVVNQTYGNVEYIVIDGASMDGTLDVIRKHEDRIDWWQSEPDGGIYDAMNKGIALATGEWIFFLNAGDAFYDNSVIYNVISKSLNLNADLIYGKIVTNQNKTGYFPKNVSTLMFILERMVCHQAIFARKIVFENNYFDTAYSIIADRVWLYKCLKKKYLIVPINEIISVYDTGGLSSNQEKFDKESLSFLRSQSYLFYVVGRTKRLFKHILC